LEKAMRSNKPVRFGLEGLPLDHEQAVKWLMALVRAAESKTLRKVTTADLLRGWYSVGFLYGGLHPDSAIDHGTEISNNVESVPEIDRTEPRLQAPYYVQSGWPVLLAPIAKEAWQRYKSGELKENEFYCSEAVIAGMCYRNPDLIEQVRQEREKISL
jgi:DNA (cytosine-5)-methyltransferase 1